MGRDRVPLAWRKRLSLQAKLSLLLGLVAVLPLLVVGYLLVRDSREVLRADALDHTAASARLGVALTQDYVADARQLVEDLATHPATVAAARAGNGPALESALTQHLRASDDKLAVITWHDAEGALRASAPPAAGGPDVRPLGLSFGPAPPPVRSVVSPPHRAVVSDQPVVAIAAPVRDETDTLGWIVGSIDLTALIDRLAPVHPGERLHLAVVDLDSGLYVAHSDRARLLQPAGGPSVVLERLRAGASGALESADDDGAARLVGYARLDEPGWAVIADEPIGHALGTALELQQRGQAVIVLAALAAMLVGWLLGRRLTRPLAELQAATARLAAGELGATVPIRSHDELGQVAASFNDMSARLAHAHAAEADLRRAAEALAAREALVNRINARVRASLDVETVLNTMLAELGGALGAARAFLMLAADGATLQFAYQWNRPGALPLSAVTPRRLVIMDLAIRERRAIAVTDIDADPRLSDPALGPRARTPEDTRAVLLAPLFHGDTLLGILGLHEVGQPRAWTADEVALVEAVAGETAVAVVNARLYEEASTRAQRLAAVTRINRAMSARLDLPTLLGVVADALGQLVPFDTLALLRLDPDGRTYRVLSPTAHLAPPPESGGRMPLAGSRLEEILRAPHPVVHADLATAAYPLTSREEQLRAEGYRSSVLVPVVVEGERPGDAARVLGALGLSSRESGRFGPAELEVLEPTVAQLAVALLNADLYAEVVAGQRRLQAIVGGIGDGVFVTDGEGCIALWNTAAERLLGYSAAEALGRPWTEVVRGRDTAGRTLDAASRALVAILRRDGVGHAEAQFLTRQGQELWVSISVSTLTVDDERHWVVVFRDISGYKEVERLKSDFVATVSHELRTPLASIKGYAATLLQRRDRLPPDTRDEYLTIINDEANRLNALVSELLEVARLERGDVRLARVPTALAPIAERVAERVARAARDTPTLGGIDSRSRHTITVAVPANVVALAAPDRLEQVITNLVENAVKYSPRGGAIRITGATSADKGVVLTVSDEGVGIPAERQPELFRPFSRIEQVLTQETQGVGLGLYICKQLIEGMGGTIALASEHGRGTTVTITLQPVVPDPPSAVGDSPPARAPADA